MSRMLELPDSLYDALREAAAARGLSPAAWISAHLSEDTVPAPSGEKIESPQTLADLFAGRVGQIGNGGQERLSESTGEQFAEHLEAKRRANHL